MKMKDRELLANVKIDTRGKKQVTFGKVWGQLKKGNTKAMKTGDGLWVLDYDSTDMKAMPKDLRKLLPKPTYKTANGYHWYFNGEGIPQTQALMPNFDVRNEGGLVFTEYTGDDTRISYEKIGKASTPSLTLMKYLKTASAYRKGRTTKVIKRAYVKGKPIKQFKDGEIHDNLVAVAIKMFNDRCSDDEVWSRLDEYRENYLSGDGFKNSHEKKLMLGRFTWSKSQIGDGRIKGKTLKTKKKKKVEAKEPDRPSVKDKTKKKRKNKMPKWKRIALQNGEFDQEKSDKVDDLDYLGYIAKGHHTVIYGASGTMKTSITVVEMVKELPKRPEMEIFFYSFDASDVHHKAIFQYLKDNKCANRFHILNESDPNEVFEMIEQAKSDESDLHNAVFIIDTYKKIVGDVNNKAKNAEVMGELKMLAHLGATILTIAHANKDGVNNSGTAELEQDSDALIRFDAHSDATGTFISITQGGRVRYEFEPLTYFVATSNEGGYYNLLKNLERLSSFVSVGTLENDAKSFDNDKVDIDKLCAIIADEKCGLRDLQSYTKSGGMSDYLTKRLIEDYEGKKWRTGEDGIIKLINVLKPDKKKKDAK